MPLAMTLGMQKPTSTATSAKKKGKSKYDSPWKMLIERHLRTFLAFFFPKTERAIDWTKPPKSLDKELESLDPEPESAATDLRVDKLFDVVLLTGEHRSVQVHVEVQSDPQESFETRMFLYAARIFDRHRQPVVSLAILGDVDKPDWKPEEFGWDVLDSRLEMEFPIVKLSDYDEKALVASSNPFALVVLAHLRAKETRGQSAIAERRRWKVWLVRLLYSKGFTKQEVVDLFRFIDGVVYLPPAANKQFRATIDKLEARKTMDYISTFEQEAMETGWTKGHEEGHQEGHREGHRAGRRAGHREGRQEGQVALMERLIQRRYNEVPAWVRKRLEAATDEELARWGDRILDAPTLADLFKDEEPTP